MTTSKLHPFLPQQIAIHQGHYTVAPEPDWTGTVEEYWQANQGTLTFGDIMDMRHDLEDFGEHKIGGGAMGCFTVRWGRNR